MNRRCRIKRSHSMKDKRQDIVNGGTHGIYRPVSELYVFDGHCDRKDPVVVGHHSNSSPVLLTYQQSKQLEDYWNGRTGDGSHLEDSNGPEVESPTRFSVQELLDKLPESSVDPEYLDHGTDEEGDRSTFDMPHMDANMTKNNLFFPVLTSGITIIGCFLTYRYIQWLKFSSITKYSYKLRHKEDFICTNIEEWSHHEQDFLNSCKKFRCLGLDCEWVTKGRSVQKVALLQLATYSGICVLLRLCHLKERLPENLLSLLNDRSILKVGVACCDDAKKLRNDYGIIVNGCLDLRHIITRYPINEEQVNSSGLGLKHLAKRVLNENINKDWWIQCGDWEATILSNKQIEYAVQDAVIAVDIFNEIMKMKILRDRRLLLFVEQTFFGSKLDLENYWNEIIEWCRLYIDVPFTSNKIYRSKTSNQSSQSKSCQQTRAFMTRDKPLYDNCQLLAPDGQVLCSCNLKKAQWYLDKSLGVLVQDDPLIVRLNFEPEGRPILDGQYYIHNKDNRCVVCKSTKSLLRKNIVPHEYRRHFPGILKSHSSHDVVILCVDCHIRSNFMDAKLRQQLALQCNAPIGSHEDMKVLENPELKRVKSAARALMHSRNFIPSKRIDELTNIICNYFNVKIPLDRGLIEEAADLETTVFNEKFVSHGKQVIEYMQEERHGGLLNFELMWRNHFLKAMDPKYLPSMWSTSHGHELIIYKLLEVPREKEKETLRSILGISKEKLAEFQLKCDILTEGY